MSIDEPQITMYQTSPSTTTVVPIFAVVNNTTPYAEKFNANYLIRVDCLRSVANKVEKFFWIANKYGACVEDVYIYEHAGPAWWPEREGTFGGYFEVIVSNATQEFLHQLSFRLPMVTSRHTTETHF